MSWISSSTPSYLTSHQDEICTQISKIQGVQSYEVVRPTKGLGIASIKVKVVYGEINREIVLEASKCNNEKAIEDIFNQALFSCYSEYLVKTINPIYKYKITLLTQNKLKITLEELGPHRQYIEFDLRCVDASLAKIFCVYDFEKNILDLDKIADRIANFASKESTKLTKNVNPQTGIIQFPFLKL